MCIDGVWCEILICVQTILRIHEIEEDDVNFFGSNIYFLD